jgi:hypothetical protein
VDCLWSWQRRNALNIVDLLFVYPGKIPMFILGGFRVGFIWFGTLRVKPFVSLFNHCQGRGGAFKYHFFVSLPLSQAKNCSTASLLTMIER